MNAKHEEIQRLARLILEQHAKDLDTSTDAARLADLVLEFLEDLKP